MNNGHHYFMNFLFKFNFKIDVSIGWNIKIFMYSRYIL